MEQSSDNWVKVIFLLLVLALVFFFLLSIGELVRIVLISALLAYIIEPVAVYIESRGSSRLAATAIIFLAVVTTVAALLFLLLPLVARQIESLHDAITSGQAAAAVRAFEDLIRQRLSFMGAGGMDLAGRLDAASSRIGEWLVSHILDVVSVMTNLVIIPFIVFFLLKDGREMKRQFIRMVPNRYFEFALTLLYKMDHQLGNYLRGQFLDALIFGAMSTVALWALGVKYYLLIGAFAGLANLIPFLGPVAGAVSAVVMSVLDTGGFVTSVYIIAAFIVMKLIDDIIVQPLVVARSVEMHPLLVLLAVLAGGKLFGILGMLLSVPATGFLKIVISESVANFRRYHLT